MLESEVIEKEIEPPVFELDDDDNVAPMWEEEARKDSFIDSYNDNDKDYIEERHNRCILFGLTRKCIIIGIIIILIIIGAVLGGVCGAGICTPNNKKNKGIDVNSVQQNNNNMNQDGNNGDNDSTTNTTTITKNPIDNSSNDATITPSISPITTLLPTMPPVNNNDNNNNNGLNYYHDVCTRANGPFRIGGKAATGTIQDDMLVSQSPCNKQLVLPGFWYSVTGGGEVIRASTCPKSINDFALSLSQNNNNNITNSTSNNNYNTNNNTPYIDTVISVLTGNFCDDLSCVAINDQFCNDQSSVSWLAEKGVTYYVLVQAKILENNNNNNRDFKFRMDYENNGDCTTAIGPLPNNNEIIAGSMQAAMVENDNEIIFSCAFVPARGGQVWYWVYGTGSWMIASTCHKGTNFGARIDVNLESDDEEICAGECANFRDSDCGDGSQMVWKSELDRKYYIAVYKSSKLPGINFELSIGSFDPVENDDCINATPIQSDGTMNIGSTLQATFEDPLLYADCQKPNLQPGVWFTVQGTGGMLLASTCNNETMYATVISVYVGNECGTSLSCVTELGNQYCNEKASVYWESLTNKTYYILVHGEDYGVFPNVGNFGLTVEPFQPEVNDQCNDAIEIELSSSDSGTAGTSLLGSTFAATKDIDAPSCTTFDSEAPGIWYKLVGPGTNLRVSTCDPQTNYDTQITVYGGSCNDLRCINTDDNSCGLQSSVVWSTTEGVTYYIFVHGRFASSVGQFAITVEEYLPLVDNDFCDVAIPAPIDGSTILGTTNGATFDNTGECVAPNTAPGVWYQVNGTGTVLSASLCTDETNFNSAISVFSGNDCVELECVTGNIDSDNTECGVKSEVAWLTRPDTTYYILVHGFDGKAGDFGLVLTEPEPPIANDFCVNAIPITLSSTIIQGTTIDASPDLTPLCTYRGNNVLQELPGVWYQLEGTGARVITSTCQSPENEYTDFDTAISIFVGSSCGELNCTRVDDDFCGLQSRLVWDTEPGVTYYILVHGFEVGNFGLLVDAFVPSTTNDYCTAAQGPLLPTGETVLGSTVGSSFDDVADCGVSNTSPGVWFFVVGTGERLTADTCNNATTFDTKLSVFTGRNCDLLECVEGNDDSCSLQSSVSWDSQIGQFYWVLLHGFDTYGVGDFGLTVSGSELFQ